MLKKVSLCKWTRITIMTVAFIVLISCQKAPDQTDSTVSTNPLVNMIVASFLIMPSWQALIPLLHTCRARLLENEDTLLTYILPYDALRPRYFPQCVVSLSRLAIDRTNVPLAVAPAR